MATLRWLVHSACHVLGYPKEENSMQSCNKVVGYPNEHGNGVMIKNSKLEMMDPSSGFQMPLHYPRYAKADYENMEEWKVDALLREYGMSFHGSLEEKRGFAMGAFLWPDQY